MPKHKSGIEFASLLAFESLGQRLYQGKFEGARAIPTYKILIVDDDFLIRWSLTQSLLNEGCEVTAVEDGGKAIDAIGNQSFDFVITDLLMPDADGWMVMEKAQEANPSPRVIVITGHGREGIGKIAMRKGAWAYVIKFNILDQIRTNIVSLRVDPKIKTIEKSRLDDVVALYYDNHYYLSYTSGGGGANDTILVYDRQRLGWWEFQVADSVGNLTGANCFSDYKDSNGQTRLYFGSATDGSIYYFDDTIKQDDGWSIITDWKSPKFSFKDYSQMKFFLEVLLYFGKQTGSPTINVYIDGTLAKTETIQIGNTGSAGIGNTEIGTYAIGVEGGSLDLADSGGGDFVKIPMNGMGRNIQIEITDEDLTGTKSWELNALHFHYKPLSVAYQPGTK